MDWLSRSTLYSPSRPMRGNQAVLPTPQVRRPHPSNQGVGTGLGSIWDAFLASWDFSLNLLSIVLNAAFCVRFARYLLDSDLEWNSLEHLWHVQYFWKQNLCFQKFKEQRPFRNAHATFCIWKVSRSLTQRESKLTHLHRRERKRLGMS
jgi:hypothetical protein